MKRQNKQNNLITHYTYESRFAHYKSQIHQIWNDIFENTPVMETTLIVDTRNNLNLGQGFVRKSPCIKTSTNEYNKTDEK